MERYYLDCSLNGSDFVPYNRHSSYESALQEALSLKSDLDTADSVYSLRIVRCSLDGSELLYSCDCTGE